MKTCRQYEDMISAFIDGVLPEEDRAALMEHMSSCPACQAYFDQQIAVHDALMADAARIQVPEGFAEGVMARVRFTAQEKPRRKPAIRWRQWTAMAACCAVVAVGLWYGAFRQDAMRSDTVSESVADDAGTSEDAMPEMTRAMPETGAGGISSAPDSAAAAKDTPEPEPKDTPEEYVYEDQETSSESMLQASPPLPAPAADLNTPQAARLWEDGLSKQSDDGQPLDGAAISSCSILTTDSQVAAVWVEEQLGLPWTPGGRYELTAEEYAGLLATLTEAGEGFTEQWEDGEGFLLIAQASAETD